jgi:hypothetical protein
MNEQSSDKAMRTIEEQLKHAEHVTALIDKTQTVLEGCTTREVFDVGLFLVSNIALQVDMPEDEFLQRCRQGRALAIEIREKTKTSKGAS